MGRLFSSVVGRDPIPAPASWIERNILHTHPGRVSAPHDASPLAAPSAPQDETGAEAEPSGGQAAAEPNDLHDRLFAAWQAKDWNALAATARSHLGAADPVPQLDPVAAAAVTFFRPAEVALQPGEAERFLAGFPDGRLAEYLATGLARDRARLADHALALHCLGLLGEATFDYVGALRSLEALAVAGRLGESAERRLSPALLDGIGQIDVALPAWAYAIDVCCPSDPTLGGRSGGDRDRAAVPTSPIETKIAAVAIRDAGARGESCCECDPGPPICMPQDPCCARVHYYMADLLELRDWPHGYVAGELAYIENIAAGETRSRVHRFKLTSELVEAKETAVHVAERRDFQVAARASLQIEIEKQLQASAGASAGVGGGFLGPFSFGAGATASSSLSASAALRIAQQSAIETVAGAVSEIEKDTRTLRSARLKSEQSEKNVHRFRNDDVKPRVTKYFWVEQKRCAQLFSYGKHLQAEFIIPEPGRLYEHLLRERCEAEVGRRLKAPPQGPARPEFNLRPQDLGKDNYRQLAAQWGVKDAPAWPPEEMELKKSASDQPPDYSIREPLHFDIPDGYEAFRMTLGGHADYWGGIFAGPRYVQARGLGLILSLPFVGGTQAAIVPRATGGQDVVFATNRTASVHVEVTLHLARKAGVLEAWQAIVFKALEAKYEQALAAYDASAAAHADYEAARDKLRLELLNAHRAHSPLANRELIAAEIKRAVIYLMCQDFSCNGAMIRRAEPCGFPEIDRGRADKKGYDWYFWDRLIDWKLMAYAFFDYFWNPMCDWPERFDPDEPDPLLKAFRRAGYARVMVPVSPAMQADFLWYVTTHQKWGLTGQPPFNPADPRWRNVVFELRHANQSAMTRREGHADTGNGDTFLVIKGSDRYWNPITGTVDLAAIALDIDRELFIECESYLITGIAQEAGSPPYDAANPNSMWWRLTLDRPYEGPTGTGRLYAMGAQAVAPKFSFQLPTELVWAGAHDDCLPTYPLPSCP